jgi:16S rRNA (guanine527-N7)-methyltransferase
MEKLVSGAARLGITLTSHQINQFQTYYELLAEWNQRINLTAIVEYQEVQIKHFLDSLTVSLAFTTNSISQARVVDVGSGAGLPGIPLKIVWPGIRLTLLESVGKKTTFLSHLVKNLGLDDVEVVTGRAEEVAHLSARREQFDVTVSRGVAGMATLTELCLPFCRIAGTFIAQKKGDIVQEMAQAERAIALLGGQLREIKTVDIPDLADNRCLIVVRKVSVTPSCYPRRPGMPGKRPL